MIVHNTREEVERMTDPKRLVHPDPRRLCDLARMADEENSTDVLGSYTGMAQGNEPPVQDADDL